MKQKFSASEYQKKILEWVKNGSGHAFVSAVAGSGKTTTLKLVSQELQGKFCFLAFNRAISQEIAAELPGVECKTLHALSFRALMQHQNYKSTKLDNYKMRGLILQVLGEIELGTSSIKASGPSCFAWIEEGSLVIPLRQFCDLYRLTLKPFPITRQSALDIIERYEIEMPPTSSPETFDLLLSFFVEVATAVLRRCKETAPVKIDFVDQLWLTATEPSILPPKYEWLLIDEAQDLSAVGLAVVRKSLYRGGRCLFVGDERQAIYGFAGADTESIQKIKEEMNAVTLPLSVCYRCPSSHVALAKSIVPEIEAAPLAKEGEIKTIHESDVTSLAVQGDLLLCRTTAPLVAQCFSLILAGKPAKVKGREIGEGILSTTKKLQTMEGFSWEKPAFFRTLEVWRKKEEEAILLQSLGDKSDERLVTLQDRVECIKIFFSKGECKNLNDFKNIVDEIFSDERGSITLSSIHRAKGLQAERVFLLKPHLLPHPKAKGWQAEQEQNLAYISRTRATQSLFFVKSPEKK